MEATLQTEEVIDRKVIYEFDDWMYQQNPSVQHHASQVIANWITNHPGERWHCELTRDFARRVVQVIATRRYMKAVRAPVTAYIPQAVPQATNKILLLI